ncbi:hypothetical protein CIK05_10240 [Bdellovibrio sp. qaytius]|nr:hypothetical protein CIK05_10240 [Bdellovibrio sp. qaytius]
MKLELKPNCLLTKRPLKLVSGPKSLFFYNKPWGELPEVLYEHGYKVSVMLLPFNNKELRQKAFANRLSELDNTHIIIDEKTHQEFAVLLQQVKNSTINIIGESFKPDYKTSSLKYKLHQAWLKYLGFETTEPQNLFLNAKITTWYAFIDYCVRLAELDFLSE